MMHKLKKILFAILCSTTVHAQSDTIIVPVGISSILMPYVNGEEVVDTGETFSGKILNGTASFYSLKFEGRKTATGEIFRHAKLTGASNNFKLNTWVRVTNLSNGRSVVVKINDRMHKKMKKKGRIVDLSRSAAQKIGITHGGLAKVKVEVINRPKLAKKLKR
jgi:rare lipoprotein A